MRALYLVRHGQPELPRGAPICLGRMDYPLSPAGIEQARQLGDYFAGLPACVAASPLRRCVQTAQGISDTYQTCDGLIEVNMGEWTGLTFECIRTRWPDLYAQRGRTPLETAPPNGESLAQCKDRSTDALLALLDGCLGGDLILAAHSGVNQMLFAALLEREPPDGYFAPQPCGSITQMLLDGVRVYPGPTGILPQELPPAIPDESTCRELLRQFGTPKGAADHCKAVADTAVRICEALKKRGICLNQALIFAGAMLHDVAKSQFRHACAGARWLTQLGYAAIGAIVGSHLELSAEEATCWSEKSVVFLADKLVQGTRTVTLEERFFSHISPEKQPYLQKRYKQADGLRRMLGGAEE